MHEQFLLSMILFLEDARKKVWVCVCCFVCILMGHACFQVVFTAKYSDCIIFKAHFIFSKISENKIELYSLKQFFLKDSKTIHTGVSISISESPSKRYKIIKPAGAPNLPIKGYMKNLLNT